MLSAVRLTMLSLAILALPASSSSTRVTTPVPAAQR